jgi:hypothetical protein
MSLESKVLEKRKTTVVSDNGCFANIRCLTRAKQWEGEEQTRLQTSDVSQTSDVFPERLLPFFFQGSVELYNFGEIFITSILFKFVNFVTHFLIKGLFLE